MKNVYEIEHTFDKLELDSLAYGTKVAAMFTKLSVTACDIMGKSSSSALVLC